MSKEPSTAKTDPATFSHEVILAVIALVFTSWMIAGSDQLAVYLTFVIFLVGLLMMAYLYIRTGRFGGDQLDQSEPIADADIAMDASSAVPASNKEL